MRICGSDERVRLGFVLRCAASPAIGFGHLFRSLALAREFADRDVEVTFAMAEGRGGGRAGRAGRLPGRGVVRRLAPIVRSGPMRSS